MLARFSAGAPIEPKIRGMFDMFRNAGGGGASLGEDRLSRAGVESLMNALYPQESQTMLEVMVTGLMQGIGSTEDGHRVIRYEEFRSACEGLDEIDTLLTVTFPVGDSVP
eukprot:COSAG05_NODE_707_length_7848_cov_6.252420_2_plen_110_part_00